MTYLERQVLLGWSKGWSFTPLRGKRPMLDGWQQRPRESLAQALAWARQGNVGLRTGMVSGVAVIDIEARSPKVATDFPPTLTVKTGGGGVHLYYRCTKPVPNSVGKLAPMVDVRGDGGQVVYVGSRHPDTGRLYEWSWKRRAPEFPHELIPAKPAPRVAQPDRVTNGLTYATASLMKACIRVASTREGSRHSTLYAQACDMGALVWAGWLQASEAAYRLAEAGISAGLDETEARNAANDGVKWGSEHPTDYIRQKASSETY